MWIFTKNASFVTLLAQIKKGGGRAGPFLSFPSSRAFQLSRQTQTEAARAQLGAERLPKQQSLPVEQTQTEAAWYSAWY